ncbi:MAG: radical SAM protein [Proteobacteria bacterium]|nr:radical SAM protein [Pseudomonadota bacterium]
MTAAAEAGRTESLCPVCLERVPARREEDGGRVYLVKTCPDHGPCRTLIWEGPPAFGSWKRPKIPTTPPVIHRPVERGCPFDCGLCPDHRQRSCTIILEVTGRCNLGCAFCYADSGGKTDGDPGLETIRSWYRSAAEAGLDFNIQLSGGEPTLRNDLPGIVGLGREQGFSFIQINTNGIRLAQDDGFVGELKSAGLDSVFLQFDTLDPETCRRMRGRDLVDVKRAAIEACGRHGLGVVLVPTLVPGINTDQVGELVEAALECSPVVRAIHFQPVSYFGRFPNPPADTNRLTLPGLMRAIEAQSGGRFKTGDFKPPGCENALCSFHANYLVLDGGEVRLLGGGASCCSAEPLPAEEGAARTVARVARQWSAPDPKALPMAPAATDGPMSLDDFLARARRNTFSVSAMAFQDVWNLDLERLKDCCIHIMTPEGRLAPFCAYNLTGADGRRLYR